VDIRRLLHSAAPTIFLLALQPHAAASGYFYKHAITMGADAPLPSLEFEATEATRIGRFRIMSTEPIHEVAGDSESICGYMYHAAAIEILKGEISRLDFYSTSANLKINHDYLLFIHQRDFHLPEAFHILSDFMTSDEKTAISCRMSGADYYLPADRQTDFAFYRDVDKRGGDDWLDGYDRKRTMAFSWCQRNRVPSPQRFPIDRILRTKERAKGDPNTLMLSWQSAKKLIQRALKNSPYSANGTPRHNFLPGGC
jgi:hypothetical protein